MIVSTLENGVVVKKQVDTICFDLTCDILCMGAGSAGVYLAAAAAREGAHVILCEISPNVGGMHVCGNVTGNYYGSPGGSYEEDLQKAAADQIFLPGIVHWEQKQIHVLERLQQSGITVLCRHSAVGIYWALLSISVLAVCFYFPPRKSLHCYLPVQRLPPLLILPFFRFSFLPAVICINDGLFEQSFKSEEKVSLILYRFYKHCCINSRNSSRKHVGKHLVSDKSHLARLTFHSFKGFKATFL